ncbi:FG-GAP repeat protein [Nannocystis pusilla]|uniref:FG-GAP repeat protein n=1 Tax=Nannocystis pusilla TaxID=889268 RepID=UPI003DA43247
MSSRARLYPLLTLCTLACSLPGEPADAAATMDESTSDASPSTGAEESSITESILTSTSAEDTASDTAGDEANVPLTAPYLYVDYSPIKRYEFSWKPIAGADYYQLLERPYPEVAGWSQLGGDLVGTSTTMSMPIHLRLSAAYKLRACNQAGCKESDPVQVDPTVDGAVGYFKASNAENNDDFGHKLAISADGTTMVVAAPGEDSGAHGVNGDELHNFAPDSGAAYVFVREGDGWKQQAYLKSFNVDPGDCFGEVAISANGDTIAVGAPCEDSAATGVGGERHDNSAQDSGAVYVFERKGSAWSQTAYVKALNTQPFAEFGAALALSAAGDTLVVGAPQESNAATGVDGDPWLGDADKAGAVYVYSRENGEWSHRAYLKASNTSQSDRFGGALALSADGNTLAVGAPLESGASVGVNGDQSEGAVYSGAVYMFTRQGGAWSQQAYIKASNTQQFDFFGYSLALAGDGDTLAVGAPFESSAATEIDGDEANDDAKSAGAIYLFSRQGQAWQQDAYVKAPNAGADALFGISVALSGDGGILVAGAQAEGGGDAGSFAEFSEGTAPDSGAAYVFSRVAGSWTYRRYLKAPKSRNDYQFGSVVDLTADGTTLVIAAPGETSTATGIGGDKRGKAGTEIGAVYMY